MEAVITGLIGIIFLVLLLFLQMPIAIVFSVVGFAGLCYLEGFDTGLNVLQTVSWSGVMNYVLSCIPFFILMGVTVGIGGVVTDLYNAANKWVRQLPGGLAIATILATAAFGAICGHSMATAATIGTIAYPEMRKHRYAKGLAAGCIAAGGSIASLIPPSIPMVIIGMLTELSIGKLLIAGLLPGILVTVSYSVLIFFMAKARPELAPAGAPSTWTEKMVSLKSLTQPLILFLIVVGGIYTGIFTPTEAAAIGAVGALLLLATKKMFNIGNLKTIFHDTGMVVCALLPILIGVFILNHFFVLDQLPFVMAQLIVPLHLSKYMLLIVICVMYLILGCFIEPLAIWLLTIPVLYPVVTQVGIDGIWFAVVVLRAGEIGLITPPVGMNVYIIKGVAKDISMFEVFRGIMPFLAMDMVTLCLLIFIPEIGTFLPGLMK